MKLSIHLLNPDYLDDYLEMGVEMIIVDSLMSSYTTTRLTLETLTHIKQKCQNAKLYVNVNALYEQHELDALYQHIDALNDLGVDGLIFQDFAVLQYVLDQSYHFTMLYHPLTLNTNHMTLNVLHQQGVDEAMVAKEIPLEEQIRINQETSIPLMIQCHGVSYMGSSRRQLLSHYGDAIEKKIDDHIYTIIPDGSDYGCYIYEDERGTSIFSQAKLYMLDLFSYLEDFEYLYIETLFMDDAEALEVVNMYADCLKAYREGYYGRYVKEYIPLLKRVSQPLERGFIEDKTIYHLDDVKRRDAGESV